MNPDSLRDFLLWCAVANYGVLLVWFLVFVLARDWLQALHGRWFRLSREQFDLVHYAAMVIYKIAILVFNLIPWLVLTLMG